MSSHILVISVISFKTCIANILTASLPEVMQHNGRILRVINIRRFYIMMPTFTVWMFHTWIPQQLTKSFWVHHDGLQLTRIVQIRTYFPTKRIHHLLLQLFHFDVAWSASVLMLVHHGGIVCISPYRRYLQCSTASFVAVSVHQNGTICSHTLVYSTIQSVRILSKVAIALMYCNRNDQNANWSTWLEPLLSSLLSPKSSKSLSYSTSIISALDLGPYFKQLRNRFCAQECQT